jgi:hypothetical protein
VRSEPTESRLGEERPEVAEAQIGTGHYQLAVVISQVAVETVAEVAFTVLFGVNVPRSRETLVKVLPDRSFLVMAETDAGDIQWHHLACAHGLQETPFPPAPPSSPTPRSSARAAVLTGGPSSAPVFVLNHWVDRTPTPRPSPGDPQRSSSAARASADVSAYPQPPPQPDRRRLLSPSGRVRRRRRAERRVPMSGRMR